MAFCYTPPWHPHQWYYYSIAVSYGLYQCIQDVCSVIPYSVRCHVLMLGRVQRQKMQNNGAYCCFVRIVFNYLSIWGTYIEYTVVCLYRHTLAIPGFSWCRMGSCCIFNFLIQLHTTLLCSLTVLIFSVANVNASHQGTLQPIPPSQAPH